MKDKYFNIRNFFSENSTFIIVGVCALCIPIIYFLKFGCFSATCLSNNNDVWGQFGDYIGGILNPFLSFFILWYALKENRNNKVLFNNTKYLDVSKLIVDKINLSRNKINLEDIDNIYFKMTDLVEHAIEKIESNPFDQKSLNDFLQSIKSILAHVENISDLILFNIKTKDDLSVDSSAFNAQSMSVFGNLAETAAFIFLVKLDSLIAEYNRDKNFPASLQSMHEKITNLKIERNSRVSYELELCIYEFNPELSMLMKARDEILLGRLRVMLSPRDSSSRESIN